MSSQTATPETEKPQQALAPQRRHTLSLTNSGLQPKTLTELYQFAKILASSPMVPKQYQARQSSAEEAVASIVIALQYGAELGLAPMAALQGIATINGRPSLYGDSFWAVITGHPDFEGATETLDEETMTASCTVRRRGMEPVTQTFSQADAQGAGLWGKQGPWTQYPKRMLQMRARGFAARDAFADALRGIHLAEESRDIETVPAATEWVDSDGQPVEGTHRFAGKEPKVVTPEPAPEPDKKPEPEVPPQAANNDAPSQDDLQQGDLGW